MRLLPALCEGTASGDPMCLAPSPLACSPIPLVSTWLQILKPRAVGIPQKHLQQAAPGSGLHLGPPCQTAEPACWHLCAPALLLASFAQDLAGSPCGPAPRAQRPCTCLPGSSSSSSSTEDPPFYYCYLFDYLFSCKQRALALGNAEKLRSYPQILGGGLPPPSLTWPKPRIQHGARAGPPGVFHPLCYRMPGRWVGAWEGNNLPLNPRPLKITYQDANNSSRQEGQRRTVLPAALQED